MPRPASLRTARLERGTVYRVAYNGSAARAYAADACPGGEGREFGPCEADRGVIVQERAGDPHVVAVALDLTVVGENRRVETTLVVRAMGGVDREWQPERWVLCRAGTAFESSRVASVLLVARYDSASLGETG